MSMQSHERDDGRELDEGLREALARGEPEASAARLRELRPSQIARTLESLAPEERAAPWRLIAPTTRGDVLLEVHGEVRRQLIEASTVEELVEAVKRLDLDALSDLYDELPDEVAEAVLRAMDAQRRNRFRTVREHEADTAGGLMDVDAITVRPDVTLKIVLDYLRRYRREHERLPPHTDAVMVVGRDDRYLGRLMLADLVSLARDGKVQEVMDRQARAIAAATPARQVARIFEDEDLVSAAVVDERDRVIGRITVDDVLDFIVEQAEQSALASAGLDQEIDTFAPALTSARHRAVWLGVNLTTALLAAWVISNFDASIDRLVSLAVLMPVVASMGGVAGTQSLALVVRGIALDQVKRGNRWQLLKRELAVGALNGVLWALVVSLVANLWFGNVQLALVFGAAVVLNLVAGVASGTLIPLALARLRVDPAIAGGVILVAVTDSLGFFLFLGLGTMLLLR